MTRMLQTQMAKPSPPPASKRIYGNRGDSLNGSPSALRRSGGRHGAGRHEESTAFATAATRMSQVSRGLRRKKGFAALATCT